MAPSAIVDTPHTQYAGVSPEIEILPAPARTPRLDKPEAEVAVEVHDLFKSALIEQNRMGRRTRPLDVLVSVVLHVTVLAVPILLSLYYTDTLNIKQFTATLLVAPPPPPPPPPAAVAVVKTVVPKRVFLQQGKLVAPKYIPQKVAEIKEAPLPDADVNGVAGGVPGGVPGGQMGGVIGGVIGGVLNSGPIAPVGKPTAPVRVGGRIKAPRAIHQTSPEYPPLAKQARISGIVVIDAVLDEKGNVVDMKILSGPPLLYTAALNALKDWKYEPTYLNETPIPVQMVVTITFQLNNGINQ